MRPSRFVPALARMTRIALLALPALVGACERSTSTSQSATSADAEDNVSAFNRDAAGRITELLRADDSSIRSEFDAGGNLVALTPPGRSAHFFQYRERTSLLDAEVPPKLALMRFSAARSSDSSVTCSSSIRTSATASMPPRAM